MAALSEIKNTEQQPRSYLTALASWAYTNSEQSPLALDHKQQRKYKRYQFTFNPSNGFQYYQNLFEAVFPDKNEQEQQAIFNQLRAAHPFGIELWVTPKNASQDPLLENNAVVVAKSIFSAAKKILTAKKKEQTDQINEYFGEKDNHQNKLERKYFHILATIETVYKNFIDNVERGYEDDAFANDDSAHSQQYAQITKQLQRFHQKVVSQLTLFSKFDGEQLNNKDYKAMFKLLGIYEQSQKLRDFYSNQNVPEDPEGDVFNRDIFTLNINEEDDNKNILKAEWHYHQRHYTMTPQQAALKLTNDNRNEAVNIHYDQPSETAHGPGYGLANSAVEQRGRYKVGDNEEKNTTIDFLNARHGSPAPNELYDETLKPLDRHEAVYLTFLNMQQHLQQLRTKAIHAAVVQAGLASEETLQIAKTLSYHITALMSDPRNRDLSDDSIIERALGQVKISDDIKICIKNNTDSILKIKNIHTHLISAGGINKFRGNETELFEDCRIAQYATRQNGAAYIYMSNGVNAFRYATIFSGALKKNNCVAMVEIFRIVNAKYPTVLVNVPSENKYTESLDVVEKAAKDYMAELANYAPQKTTHDRLQRELKQLYADLERFKSLQLMNSVNSITEKIRKKKEELKGSENSLRPLKKKLNTLKTKFDRAEKRLHKQARAYNRAMRRCLKNNKNKMDSLSNREEALAFRAFTLAEELFNGKFGILRLDKWKQDKYNGVMQALLQLTAQLSDTFSSSGCKSANDRELLLALIVSQLSEVIADDSIVLDESYLNKILENAQKAYAWHISHRQTALDRSALPKTDAGLLEYAKKTLQAYANGQANSPPVKKDKENPFKTYGKLGGWAAHKRAEKSDGISEDTLLELTFSGNEEDSSARADYALYKSLVTSPASKLLTTAVTELRLFCINSARGANIKTKLDHLARIEVLAQKVPDFLKDLQIRKLRLQAEQWAATEEGRDINHSPQCQQLKELLLLLKQLVDQEKHSAGKGLKEIKEEILVGNVQNDDFDACLARFYQLYKVAITRHDDWTNSIASKGTFFQVKRPEWMRVLYDALQGVNLGDNNFEFKAVLTPQLKQQMGAKGIAIPDSLQSVQQGSELR